MTDRVLALFLLLALSASLSADDGVAPPLIAATDDAALKAAKAKIVLVRGKITRTGKSKATGVNFLNFGDGEFTVVTFGKSLKAFPDGEPADVYKDKFVEIRGEVTFYKEMPQIELVDPAQIRIIDEKAAAEAIAKVPAAPEAVPPAETAEPAAERPTSVDPRKYFSD